MTKIVLIGAGSTNFGLGIVGDILKSKVLDGCTIVLHDINKESLMQTYEIALQYKRMFSPKTTLEATLNRKTALKDASFCLISIEVGNRFELWDQDWKVPLQYGIRQIYGENGGPGGLFHSLRIIPPILDICEDINNICPEAIVFNYSNPMQRICHAARTKYPNLQFFGLCHEIESMKRQLPNLMETNFSNIEITAGGLNHFSILLDARYKDTDKSGYVKINEKFNNYYSTLVNDHEGFLSVAGAERGVFFALYKKYGYLPITTDSHLGEYIPWAYSVADHEGILDFYENYKRKCLDFFDNKSSYDHFFDIENETTHERAIPIIESILDNKVSRELAVNIPNTEGFIDCLPRDIVVEVPAMISSEGIRGIKLDAYPKTFGTLLNLQAGVIQLTTEAVLTKSKHVARLALMSDPTVNDLQSMEKLFDNMFNLQNEFLNYLN